MNKAQPTNTMSTSRTTASQTFRLCEVLSQVKINEDTNSALLNDVEVAVNKWSRAQ